MTGIDKTLALMCCSETSTLSSTNHHQLVQPETMGGKFGNKHDKLFCTWSVTFI